jgi:hypothetical protein
MKTIFDVTAFILANELADAPLVVVQEQDGTRWISQCYAGADMACLIPLGRLSEAQRAVLAEKLIALGKFVVSLPSFGECLIW